jgi:hypothetical protein
VTLYGLSFTSVHQGLPALEPGSEALLLLTRTGDTYRVAGTYYGAFRISHDEVRRLTKKESFAQEVQGVRVAVVEADLVKRITALHAQH